jgi:transcriptional regulator with XRE-family HTH domain
LFYICKTIYNLILRTLSDILLYFKCEIDINYYMAKFPEDIADTLRLARADKALSQRELGERTGVPQSHISKIEQGAVDLRVSSLRAIANALDLEIALVPRKAMPAVKSIARSAGAQSKLNSAITSAANSRVIPVASGGAIPVANSRIVPLGTNEVRPAYRLDDDDDA